MYTWRTVAWKEKEEYLVEKESRKSWAKGVTECFWSGYTASMQLRARFPLVVFWFKIRPICIQNIAGNGQLVNLLAPNQDQLYLNHSYKALFYWSLKICMGICSHQRHSLPSVGSSPQGTFPDTSP